MFASQWHKFARAGLLKILPAMILALCASGLPAAN
jgi:hypothetical protein